MARTIDAHEAREVSRSRSRVWAFHLAPRRRSYYLLGASMRVAFSVGEYQLGKGGARQSVQSLTESLNILLAAGNPTEKPVTATRASASPRKLLNNDRSDRS
ncbi:hypothetical protein [Caballeronia sp. AZ7_KS35]|uniref:hypothetical protein n=1 Tax=Caballeronia sp. AZ7_KS35 TaxID=2921762 RepID=UPI0020288F75|nr:hypothetical protein [Caballeronia sp. AZ7_KS35]